MCSTAGVAGLQFVIVLLHSVAVVVVVGFGFVPSPVRGEICGTIEDFVTFGASVLYMDDHGASAEEKERDVKKRVLLVTSPIICMRIA